MDCRHVESQAREATHLLCAAVTSDHPYVTSAAILIVLTLVLSPYLLTALLALFVATGVPRLPAPIRNFLPAPVLEVSECSHHPWKAIWQILAGYSFDMGEIMPRDQALHTIDTSRQKNIGTLASK